MSRGLRIGCNQERQVARPCRHGRPACCPTAANLRVSQAIQKRWQSFVRAAQGATARAAQDGAHLLHELVGDAFHGKHQLDGSAALATVGETALHHVAGCQLQVRVLQHYAGVLAAQLLRSTECRPNLAAMRMPPLPPAPAKLRKAPLIFPSACSCQRHKVRVVRRLVARFMSAVPGLPSRLDKTVDDTTGWQTGSTVQPSAHDSMYQYPTVEPRV